jgi:hypothetical protein
MEERLVSFTDKDKALTKEDIPKLEQVLGYQIDVPEDFFEEAEDDRDFSGFLDVLAENKKAIILDWKWDADELFEQLVPVYPDQGIKLLSSSLEYADNTPTTVHIEYEVDGLPGQVSISWDEGPFRWIEGLNQTLSERTGSILVQYDTGSDDRCWFKAKKDFSEEEFNAATSE